MKLKTAKKCLVGLCAIMAVVTLGSASTAVAESIEKADKKDIEMLLDAASGKNSAYWALLIGETRGRVYIEYTTAVHASSFLSKKPKTIVYWVPRAEITDEQLAKLKRLKEQTEENK